MLYFTTNKRKELNNYTVGFSILLHILLCFAKTSSNIASKNKVQIENIQGYSLKNISNILSEEFHKITNEELGVTVIQGMYSKLKYTLVVQDVDKAMKKMATKLESKLNESFAILNQARDRIGNYSKMNKLSMYSAITPCRFYDRDSDKYEIITVDPNNSYSELPPTINEVLYRQAVSAKKLKSAIKQIYFLSTFDVLRTANAPIYNCDDQDQSVLWKLYMEHRKSFPRNVMLLLDHGGSLSKQQFRIVKAVGITNHSLGFQQALQTLKASNISSNQTVMLLYISRGLLSSLTEAKIVLETISNAFDDLDNRVIINTCAVIDESKPVMYETHFLRDIAEQNYSKYSIEYSYEAQKGIMLSVNSTQAIGLAVARFYNVLGYLESFQFEPTVSLPTWDNIAGDMTISIIIPSGENGELGLLGLDLLYSSFAEDVTYYSNHQHYTYAFIINNHGVAVMHPSYPRPASIKEQIKFVDISHLEKHDNFKEVRTLLLTLKPEGSHILKASNETLKYIWKWVRDIYAVCVVTYENNIPPVRPHKVSWFPITSTSKVVHHRLDILPVANLCRHLNQVATIDAGSLYLSASCFQSPFSYIHTSTSEALSQLNSYMAYLKDSTRLLANPGLKEEVRDDVAALSHILEFLHMQHMRGERAKYIVRRYVASPTGVLEIYPGGFVSPGVEPITRAWYLRAAENKFRTILTPPYLDAGGAGYIVTVAYATTHAVIAMDVTFGYVYKIMLQQMPFCSEKNVKCFMMDDRGYLIYHPNLIDPNGHGPIEQQHIIHKESLVANDILNHKHFMKKILCNNYADGTIQRYYRLNMSLSDVVVNVVHGEHCVKYQVVAIDGTNMFVGVVNATCEVVATFCPCSMVDRLCLNCNRMEQRECECPCECPLNLDTCTHPNRTHTDNPICSSIPEQTILMPSQTLLKVDADLKSCIPVSCESKLSYEACLGVLGCEWCQLDVDGETLLASPFCTSFSTCFNGILGSATPYGDAVGGASMSEDLLGSSYSPLGPIIGSIVGVCVILGFLFFCYRTYSSPAVERFYLTAAQDNQVRMSDFNVSDEFQECDNHQDKLLQETKKREPISPYCVSTGYRRPLTAADSDHGYSTMTPHDESEHLSFAPIELDSLEDDCISDATSINTSVSSKQPKGNSSDLKHKIKSISPLDLQMTTIPTRIIAPVTVHRNMEVSQ